MTEYPKRYLDLMNFKSPEEAYEKVKELTSDLTNDQHLVRSCIFDLHAAVEVELRRIFYHTFKAHLFLTDDEQKNSETIARFDKTIARLSFASMYRVLRPIFEGWPYPDLASIADVNEARNLAAHENAVETVLYKGRNPFKDADCFAQMYFDVWAIKQSVTKYFEWTISMPKERLKRYIKKYGTDEW